MPMYENQLGSLRDEVDVRLLWGLGPQTENDNGDVSTPKMDEKETCNASTQEEGSLSRRFNKKVLES